MLVQGPIVQVLAELIRRRALWLEALAHCSKQSRQALDM